MGVGLSLLFWKIQNNLLQEECVMFFNHVALLPGHLRWAHHRCCCRWHPRTRTESFSWGESHLRGSSCHYHDWGNWRWAGWRGERCLFLEAPSLRSSRGDVRCRWDFPRQAFKSTPVLWLCDPVNPPHHDPRLSPLMAKLSSSFPISISTDFLRGPLLFPKNQGCVWISEETEKQDTLGYNWAYF